MSSEPPPPSYNEATTAPPYPPSVTPYPPSAAPYPPSDAPYPHSDTLYPPSAAPYPPSAAPYPGSVNEMAYPPAHLPQYTPVASEKAHSTVNLIGDDAPIVQHIISFDNKSVRLGFIRKVFLILVLQMAVTMGMIVWFLFHEPTKLYVQSSIGLYIASYVLFLVLYFVLVCCTSIARKHPINLILLAIFTLSLGYLVAAISSFHDTKIVLALFGMTLLISACIIVFASQTKIDFTACASVLFVCTLSLFFFGLFAGVMVPRGYMTMLNVVYSSLGALLFMVFLAFDTQLIIGGKKYEIDPEDYVFAAMMLYVDIIYIFLFLLSLFGGSN